MKTKFKVGDIVRIKPVVREIIFVDEWDEKTPYQLDGDDDFRLKWWSDDMLEKYEPKFELTAEEVEILENIVAKEYLDIQFLIKTYENDKLYVNVMRDKATILYNLLTRIQQYQDADKTREPTPLP